MPCQAGENTGISPLRSCLDERWEALHFVLQAKPVPLKHMETSSKGADVGLPLLPPRWQEQLLGWKALLLIIFHQADLHIKKAENRGNYFFLSVELCFPDGLVLLENWLNGDFSIFIVCSKNIKLYFSSCMMQDWFSGLMKVIYMNFEVLLIMNKLLCSTDLIYLLRYQRVDVSIRSRL